MLNLLLQPFETLMVLTERVQKFAYEAGGGERNVASGSLQKFDNHGDVSLC